MIVTLDYETVYTQDYSLRKMSVVDYVLHPMFDVIMCSIKVDNNTTVVHYGTASVKAALDKIPWANVGLLSHNTQFDGCILAWRFGHVPKLYLDTLSMSRATLHSITGSSSLASIAKYMNLPPKGDAVVNAMGKTYADFTPEQLAEYGAYCAHDTDLCRVIFDRLLPRFPRTELALIDLNLRLFIQPQAHLDPNKLSEALAQVRAEKAQALAQVAHIEKDVFSSNIKFAKLLEAHGVTVPRKISRTTGQETYALARNDREFKELCEDEDQTPVVKALLAARMGVKSTIDETRAATMLNLSLREWGEGVTGLMPVPYRYYGAHCVPGDTEVLTHNGWVPLEEWEGGDIAQVNEKQEIVFLPAERFVGPVTDAWISVRAPYVQCDFTPGHTVPRLMQHHFTWGTIQAHELLSRSFVWAPLAGRLLDTGSTTPEQMRVLAMVQADGHWETDTSQGRGLYIFVKKPRKILRARELLRAAGVMFRELEFPSHPGFVRFVVSHADTPMWLTPERKFFGSWLLDSTPDAREALMNEIQHWDGWVQGNQVCYSTSDPVNAEWLITIAHLTGRCASSNTHIRGVGRRPNFRVQLRQRSYGMIENKHTEQRSHQQRAYCATTQTGFFLARSHDQIFVTGNTGRFSGDGGFNFANLRRTSPIRGAITAPNGYKIVHRDSSQIEARMVAWMAGCIQLLDAFAEGRDIYSEFASDVYGRSITKADKLERFVGKTATLGLSYGLGWEKFRHTLYIGNGGVSVDVSDAFAAQVVSHYRHTYYQIPRLWQNATVMLRSMIHDGSPYEPGTRVPFVEHVEPIPGITPGIEALWLPNGLCIAYPELREEIVNASTGRRAQLGYTGTRKQFVNLHGGKCVENMSQALARIVVTDISLRVKAQTGYHPIMMTYDSLDYCLPADQAEAMDALLAREFAVRPVWASTLPLASEGGWGVTLADAERGVNT